MFSKHGHIVPINAHTRASNQASRNQASKEPTSRACQQLQLETSSPANQEQQVESPVHHP
ncbi:hypothetical protein M3J09_004623 [Ascochyta lentis]